MKVEFDGKTYLYDPTKIKVSQAYVIQNYTRDEQYPTGRGFMEWQQGFQEMKPNCMQALLWKLKNDNGEPCTIEQVGDFDMGELMAAIGKAAQEEDAVERPTEAAEEAASLTV